MTGEIRALWVQRFNSTKADGVDFVSCKADGQNATVYASYTKEEFFKLDNYAYPRSQHLLWKMIFGTKCYII